MKLYDNKCDATLMKFIISRFGVKDDGLDTCNCGENAL
jgi:hypothetical protein